jgi:hypothetical protein
MEKQFAVKGQSHIDSQPRSMKSVGRITPTEQVTDICPIAAVEHLMTYWSILEKVKGSQLRLTKMDDLIYVSFMKEFPDFNPAAPLDEDAMKSKAGKEKWRNWVNQFEKEVEDFNFGTMIRSRPDVEYDQDTTIFGLRMQFYAIEIAR